MSLDSSNTLSKTEILFWSIFLDYLETSGVFISRMDINCETHHVSNLVIILVMKLNQLFQFLLIFSFYHLIIISRIHDISKYLLEFFRILILYSHESHFRQLSLLNLWYFLKNPRIVITMFMPELFQHLCLCPFDSEIHLINLNGSLDFVLVFSLIHYNVPSTVLFIKCDVQHINTKWFIDILFDYTP